MKLVLDNNSLFSIMNPNSVSAYLFLSIKAEFFAPELIKSEFDEYDEFLDKSIKNLPDPKDAPYLALALLRNASIWSNDPHLKEQSLVKVYTTKELVEALLEEEL